MKIKFLVLFLFINILKISAQETTEKSKYDPTVVFNPLLYFQPSTIYRSGSGNPGPGYWQNQANYKISATLDTEQNRIFGNVKIEYVNNSPDELTFIWLQLDQNKFNPTSRGSKSTPVSLGRYGIKNFDGGYAISNLKLEASGNKYSGQGLKSIIDDSRLQIFLNEPLRSKQKAEISMEFEFLIPKNGADRMGMFEAKEGIVYEIAQWFPRVCVYDDIEGWNTTPYLGAGEFYLEYGNYDFEITVPYDHIVVASGKLMNPKDVLTSKQIDRLKKAQNSDETIEIVEKNEIGKSGTRPKNNGTLTWKFSCEIRVMWLGQVQKLLFGMLHVQKCHLVVLYWHNQFILLNMMVKEDGDAQPSIQNIVWSIILKLIMNFHTQLPPMLQALLVAWNIQALCFVVQVAKGQGYLV